jgi:hypothetical protein
LVARVGLWDKTGLLAFGNLAGSLRSKTYWPLATYFGNLGGATYFGNLLWQPISSLLAFGNLRESPAQHPVFLLLTHYESQDLNWSGRDVRYTVFSKGRPPTTVVVVRTCLFQLCSSTGLEP